MSYKEDVVPTDLKERLLAFLEEQACDDFKCVGGNRDVLYYGEHNYWYTGAYHEAKETPMEIQELLDSVRPTLDTPKAWFNSCLVNRYKSSESHIPMHRDDEADIDPESIIVTVSIGAERTIKFTNDQDSRELTLKDSSVFVMTRFSQDLWHHGIEPLSDGPDNTTETRYSFTFRHLAPFFRNSTIVIGDSNTQHLKFGKDIGTFGRWVPGKRVKAGKIEDIPTPDEIGPYRNIVIHTGINDIRDANRRSSKSLITNLRTKCDDIQKVYPNAKLYISLLLPSKSGHMNTRINEFNSLILDIAYNKKNILIIENSFLGTVNGCMPAKYGRYYSNGMANASDIVHLGKVGIRAFCKNIKASIMARGRNQSRERFQAGRGNYSHATGRDTRG